MPQETPDQLKAQIEQAKVILLGLAGFFPGSHWLTVAINVLTAVLETPEILALLASKMAQK